MKWVFFGTSEFSVYVLEELKIHHIVPDLIITTPDKPKGRKLILTPTPVKVWANENNIEVLDPPSLKKNNSNLISKLQSLSSKLFLVASYGKIIPREIFEIPEHKTLNIHPSLLPKYRGASPIQAQILNDEKNIGVTLMQIDEGMDTGPIITQRTSPLTPLLNAGEGKHISRAENSDAPLPSPAPRGRAGDEVFGRVELEKILAIESAQLFAEVLPKWLEGKIIPTPQDNSQATECSKITKEDGEINLKDDPYKNFLKIKAYEGWPGTYFFKDGKRIKITKAKFENNELVITRVIPEGKTETDFKTLKP